MVELQVGETLTAQFMRGISLIDEGIQCMNEADPNSGIGARITGSQICDKALTLASDRTTITENGELSSVNMTGLFTLKGVYPEAFHWYLAQSR